MYIICEIYKIYIVCNIWRISVLNNVYSISIIHNIYKVECINWAYKNIWDYTVSVFYSLHYKYMYTDAVISSTHLTDDLRNTPHVVQYTQAGAVIKRLQQVTYTTTCTSITWQQLHNKLTNTCLKKICSLRNKRTASLVEDMALTSLYCFPDTMMPLINSYKMAGFRFHCSVRKFNLHRNDHLRWSRKTFFPRRCCNELHYWSGSWRRDVEAAPGSSLFEWRVSGVEVRTLCVWTFEFCCCSWNLNSTARF